MPDIVIRRTLDSDTLHLPELRPLIGKTVEIIVVELAPATREEVFREALRTPETAEEHAAQQATFRAWLADPRYEFLRPMIQRLIDPPDPVGPPATGTNGSVVS